MTTNNEENTSTIVDISDYISTDPDDISYLTDLRKKFPHIDMEIIVRKWDTQSLTNFFLENPEHGINRATLIGPNKWIFNDIKYGEYEVDFPEIEKTLIYDDKSKRKAENNTDILSHLLPEDVVYYNKELPDSSCGFKPSYVSEKHKLIIQVDILYHNSTIREGNVLGIQIDKNYHWNQFKEYTKLGYKFLSFNDWEIENKFEIVKSVIYNKMGLNKKIYARKCELVELNSKQANEFFEQNHLMGKGSGKTWALKYEGEIVCALRYVHQTKEVHVNRFACKNFTSVIGGYSKLLKHLDIFEKDIVNFVDCRHGTGSHLLEKGFKLINESPGFWWTDGKTICNRRKYLGSSGLQKGFERYWDAGQRKYVKAAPKNNI